MLHFLTRGMFTLNPKVEGYTLLKNNAKMTERVGPKNHEKINPVCRFLFLYIFFNRKPTNFKKTNRHQSFFFHAKILRRFFYFLRKKTDAVPQFLLHFTKPRESISF